MVRSLDELVDTMRRHPIWMTRLATNNFVPVARINVRELQSGDIIDIREFGIAAEGEDCSFLVLEIIHRNERGVFSLKGKLANGTSFTVVREDGLPWIRRQVVRYVRRHEI